MVLALPGHAGEGGDSTSVAARIKRAKATALNDIAMELNRQEIRDIQSRANQGGVPHAEPRCLHSTAAMVLMILSHTRDTPAHAHVCRRVKWRVVQAGLGDAARSCPSLFCPMLLQLSNVTAVRSRFGIV